MFPTMSRENTKTSSDDDIETISLSSSEDEVSLNPSVPPADPSPVENADISNANNSTSQESNSESTSVPSPTENPQALSANNDISNDDSNSRSPSVISISPDADDNESVISVNDSDEEGSESPFEYTAGASPAEDAKILISTSSSFSDESSLSEPSADPSPVEDAPVLNGNSSDDNGEDDGDGEADDDNDDCGVEVDEDGDNDDDCGVEGDGDNDDDCDGDGDNEVDDDGSSAHSSDLSPVENLPLDNDSETQTSFEGVKPKREKNNGLHIGEQTPHTCEKYRVNYVFPSEDSLETARKRLSIKQVPKIRDLPLPSLAWSDNWKLIERLFSEENMSLDNRDPSIFRRHPHLITRMRAILFDWLIEVCDVYKLRRATYYLAIDYVDRYLSKKAKVQKNELQLIGITCLFLAAKVHEIYPPKITELAYVTDGACSDDDMMNKEMDLLTLLGWDVQPITASEWLALFLQIASTNGDNIRGTNSPSTSDKEDIIYPQYSPQTFMHASMILDLCSLDDGMLQFKYSVIAASILYYVLNREKALFISGLKWYHIRVCTEWVMPFAEVVNRALGQTTIVPRRDKFRKGSGLRVKNPNIILDEGHTIQNHVIDLKLLDEVYKEINLYREEHRVGKTHATGWNSTTEGFSPCGRRPSILEIYANDTDFAVSHAFEKVLIREYGYPKHFALLYGNNKVPVAISSDPTNDLPNEVLITPNREDALKDLRNPRKLKSILKKPTQPDYVNNIELPSLENPDRQTYSPTSETETQSNNQKNQTGSYNNGNTSPSLIDTARQTNSPESETEAQSNQNDNIDSHNDRKTSSPSPMQTNSPESETEIQSNMNDNIDSHNNRKTSSPSPIQTNSPKSETETQSNQNDNIDSHNDRKTSSPSPMETNSPKSETETQSNQKDKIDSHNDRKTSSPSPTQTNSPKSETETQSNQEDKNDSHNDRKTSSPSPTQTNSPKSETETQSNQEDKIDSHNDRKTSAPSPTQTNSPKSETETQSNQEDKNDSHNDRKTSSPSPTQTNSPKSETETQSNQEDKNDSHNDRKTSSPSPMQTNSPNSETETKINNQMNQTDSCNETIEHEHTKSPDTCQNRGVKRLRDEESIETVDEPPRKMSCHEIPDDCPNMLASPACSGLYLKEKDTVFFGLRRTNPVSSVLPPEPKEPPMPDQETLEMFIVRARKPDPNFSYVSGSLIISVENMMFTVRRKE